MLIVNVARSNVVKYEVSVEDDMRKETALSDGHD